MSVFSVNGVLQEMTKLVSYCKSYTLRRVRLIDCDERDISCGRENACHFKIADRYDGHVHVYGHLFNLDRRSDHAHASQYMVRRLARRGAGRDLVADDMPQWTFHSIQRMPEQAARQPPVKVEHWGRVKAACQLEEVS